MAQQPEERARRREHTSGRSLRGSVAARYAQRVWHVSMGRGKYVRLFIEAHAPR